MEMLETWENLVSVETEKLDEALAVSALPEIWICPLSIIHSFPFNALSHFFCFPIMVQCLKKCVSIQYIPAEEEDKAASATVENRSDIVQIKANLNLTTCKQNSVW